VGSKQIFGDQRIFSISRKQWKNFVFTALQMVKEMVEKWGI